MAEIPSTPADGNVLVLLVPAIADTSAPKLTEMSGSGVVDISCYLTGSGLKPSNSTATINDDRLCSREVYELPGRATNSLEVEYIDNTNAPNSTTDNKAKDTLVPRSRQYLVIRRGKAYETPLAVGDKVTIYPIMADDYNEMAPEANSVLKIGQKLFVTGPTKKSVALAA